MPIYEHKELMRTAVEQLYPTRRQVMVNDKVRLLSAMKSILRDHLTTVFLRQGHYSIDVTGITAFPTPTSRSNELLTSAALIRNLGGAGDRRCGTAEMGLDEWRRTPDERSSGVRCNLQRRRYFVPRFGAAGGVIGLLMS